MKLRCAKRPDSQAASTEQLLLLSLGLLDSAPAKLPQDAVLANLEESKHSSSL